MLFMKEKREEVGIQFNLKDSAAINKVLGQMVRQKDGHNLIMTLLSCLRWCSVFSSVITRFDDASFL